MEDEESKGAEVYSHPHSKDSGYSWTFDINVSMKGKITRLSSRNHQINHELSADGRQAKVSLASQDASGSDFVLYIKDDMASIPAAISHVN